MVSCAVALFARYRHDGTRVGFPAHPLDTAGNDAGRLPDITPRDRRAANVQMFACVGTACARLCDDPARVVQICGRSRNVRDSLVASTSSSMPSDASRYSTRFSFGPTAVPSTSSNTA